LTYRHRRLKHRHDPAHYTYIAYRKQFLIDLIEPHEIQQYSNTAIQHHNNVNSVTCPTLGLTIAAIPPANMASEDTTAAETDPQLSFKVKTSSDGNHSITISAAATVLDLKNKLSGDDYEKVPAERQRLIYSGRVMKNEDQLSKYNIKTGNTIHMVKSAASNAAQAPTATASATGGAPRAAAGVPSNMAAGTANNPLAGLTGARYAGHIPLPSADMFGVDGGVSHIRKSIH
jgi:Ubiquitin family